MNEGFSAIVKFGKNRILYGFYGALGYINEFSAVFAKTSKRWVFGAELENFKEEIFFMFNTDLLMKISSKEGEGSFLDLGGNYFKFSGKSHDFKKTISLDFGKDGLENIELGEVLVQLICYIKTQAEITYGKIISMAYIVHPFDYQPEFLQVVKAATKFCKIIVEDFITELHAATVHRKLENKLLYVKFGSRSLDMAIISKNEKRNIEVMKFYKDESVKGDDLNEILLQYLGKQIESKTSLEISSLSKKAKLRLNALCDSVKRDLSQKPIAEINIDFLKFDEELIFKISRPLFEELCREKFKTFADVLSEYLKNNGESPFQSIIICGGNMKIPKIRSIIRDFFPNRVIDYLLKEEILQLYEKTLMHKNMICCGFPLVIPFDLGIETKGEKMRCILKEYTLFPCIRKEIFLVDNSFPDLTATGYAMIKIFEGGSGALLESNKFHCYFKLGAKPNDRIEISFDLDADENLAVAAINLESCVKEKLTLANSSLVRKHEDVEVLRLKLAAGKRTAEDGEVMDGAKNINFLPFSIK